MEAASQTIAPLAASLRLRVRRLDFLPDSERAFVRIYGASPTAFWLDSSADGERGRFSFMGDDRGPLGAVITYEVGEGRVRVERCDRVEFHDGSIFDFLDRELGGLRRLSSGLPFDFDCGFAGYFGYELKADCGGAAAHRATTADAAFVFADRVIAFDHAERATYLLCLVEAGDVDGAGQWMQQTSSCLASLLHVESESPPPGEPLKFELSRSRSRYMEDIEACKRHLEAGHSYEICLTNKLVARAAPEPLPLYRLLRRANPAPFAAFLRFGDLAVLSSSPERFLSVDRERRVEARPIKGTSPRGESEEEDERFSSALQADEKSRAENVTIVDLLRNDLGRICEVGSVEVSELMQVETYETMHHLVSGVRGRLREGVGRAGCIRACFPPGSMTGAPKLRTMEIIDQLEGEARGAYSGAVGYLGLGGGCDLSVAIRTLVLNGELAQIGAGGAIVNQSDAEEEVAEMLLKAAAVATATQPRARSL